MIDAVKTDAERVEWSRRYQMALRRFFRQGKSASLLPAARLGCRAVSLGFETLDVARIHEQTLTDVAQLRSSSRSSRLKMAKEAKVFFAEVIVPIEATHRAALKAEVRIDQLTQKLRRRKNELSVSTRRRQRATAQRQAAEAVFQQSADHHAKMLAEAQCLQTHLRCQTRRILSAQEDERERISVEIRNEIAQALFAIDLSLLAMQTSASVNTGNVEKKLAKVQRQVETLLKAGHVRDR